MRPAAVLLLGAVLPSSESQLAPSGCATCQVPTGSTVLASYGFEDVVVAPGLGNLCDNGGFSTGHAITPVAGSMVVSSAGNFATSYADTLCADGSKLLHAANCTTGDAGTGAKIGVVNNASPRNGPGPDSIDYANLAAPEGSNFFQINANGVDGFTYVCFEPVTLSVPGPAIASINIYNGQAGWHEEPDRLRVWAEVTDAAGVSSAVSMLPLNNTNGCTAEVNKHNIDNLLLRQSATQAEWTGEHNAAGDPAILQDGFAWTPLSAELGAVATVRVCAGLQVGFNSAFSAPENTG